MVQVAGKRPSLSVVTTPVLATPDDNQSPKTPGSSCEATPGNHDQCLTYEILL
jgi:hypothetical protein